MLNDTKWCQLQQIEEKRRKAIEDLEHERVWEEVAKKQSDEKVGLQAIVYILQIHIIVKNTFLVIKSFSFPVLRYYSYLLYQARIEECKELERKKRILDDQKFLNHQVLEVRWNQEQMRQEELEARLKYVQVNQ